MEFILGQVSSRGTYPTALPFVTGREESPTRPEDCSRRFLVEAEGRGVLWDRILA